MPRSRTAAPKAKSSTAGSKGRASSTPAAGRALVRMYRQGLGDCFLITLPKRDGSPWHMLIDCGVILGTKDVRRTSTTVCARLLQTS